MFKYEYDRKRTGEQSYLERTMEKEKIGKYIRKKRIEKGMTQQQLAERIIKWRRTGAGRGCT